MFRIQVIHSGMSDASKLGMDSRDNCDNHSLKRAKSPRSQIPERMDVRVTTPGNQTRISGREQGKFPMGGGRDDECEFWLWVQL